MIYAASEARTLLSTNADQTQPKSLPSVMDLVFSETPQIAPSRRSTYITPANLCYAERRKSGNIFTMTPGPHGATIEDIVESFRHSWKELERGVLVNINGKRLWVHVPGHPIR